MQQEHALVDSILNYKQENLEKPIQAALLDITVSWNKDLKGFHLPNVTSIMQCPISNLCYNTVKKYVVCLTTLKQELIKNCDSAVLLPLHT